MSAEPARRRWFTDEEIARAKRLREGGYTFQEIADRMRTTKARIGKLSKRGWKRHTFPIPQRPGDLSLQAEYLTFFGLIRHYHVSAKYMRQWLDEAGIVLPDRRWKMPRRERPADFAEQAARLGSKALMRHYSAGQKVVARWRAELAAENAAHLPKPAAERIGWADRYYQAAA